MFSSIFEIGQEGTRIRVFVFKTHFPWPSGRTRSRRMSNFAWTARKSSFFTRATLNERPSNTSVTEARSSCYTHSCKWRGYTLACSMSRHSPLRPSKHCVCSASFQKMHLYPIIPAKVKLAVVVRKNERCTTRRGENN